MSVLIAGAYENGLETGDLATIEEIRKRRAAGFRLLPEERTMMRLVDQLTGYDTLVEELLQEENTPLAPAKGPKATT